MTLCTSHSFFSYLTHQSLSICLFDLSAIATFRDRLFRKTFLNNWILLAQIKMVMDVMNVVVLELQHAVHDRHNELGDYVTDI